MPIPVVSSTPSVRGPSQTSAASGSSHTPTGSSHPSSCSPSTTPDTEPTGGEDNEEDEVNASPPPPIAARPERTKSIVSMLFKGIKRMGAFLGFLRYSTLAMLSK
jgi:hypothetical protein